MGWVKLRHGGVRRSMLPGSFVGQNGLIGKLVEHAAPFHRPHQSRRAVIKLLRPFDAAAVPIPGSLGLRTLGVNVPARNSSTARTYRLCKSHEPAQLLATDTNALYSPAVDGACNTRKGYLYCSCAPADREQDITDTLSIPACDGANRSSPTATRKCGAKNSPWLF